MPILKYCYSCLLEKIHCLGPRTVTLNRAGGQLCCQSSAYHVQHSPIWINLNKKEITCACFSKTCQPIDFVRGQKSLEIEVSLQMGHSAAQRLEHRPSRQCLALASSISLLWISKLERGCISPLRSHPSPWQDLGNVEEKKEEAVPHFVVFDFYKQQKLTFKVRNTGKALSY